MRYQHIITDKEYVIIAKRLRKLYAG